eukprot:CAMPEP_0174295556 /NCGR_PEP_ID=MMETSP0809-20121228/45151_1 /TAXON_ID=73025 ORGANISM="Eutreptiella gymnastica-like, Strain CCMP1594" /NCGR_SAMPLE_ID=MMETSP0809 /ASSEMBLY_ACC=CAM_ASM_000658 /LENGTH=82 /DNA_ID=CAMNT_0015397933 /DNA_START=66 /DNA_END=310 /DNA_ORIENTATION=+
MWPDGLSAQGTGPLRWFMTPTPHKTRSGQEAPFGKEAGPVHRRVGGLDNNFLRTALAPMVMSDPTPATFGNRVWPARAREGG